MTPEQEENVARHIRCAIPDIARKCGVYNDDVIRIMNLYNE